MTTTNRIRRGKSPAERKRDEYARHREAGRVLMQVWVKPEQRAAVRELERRLQSE